MIKSVVGKIMIRARAGDDRWKRKTVTCRRSTRHKMVTEG